jgi:hypothetical protein
MPKFGREVSAGGGGGRVFASSPLCRNASRTFFFQTEILYSFGFLLQKEIQYIKKLH